MNEMIRDRRSIEWNKKHTAAGRIGRYPVGSLRGTPVGALRGKQLRKEQNQNQQQSFHNRHVLG